MIASEIARESIRTHEGFRGLAYDDATGLAINAPQGHLTIGWGRNLQSRGISEDEAEFMLDNDIEIAERDAIDLIGPQWESLSINRQAVVIEMSFQLGRKRLGGFQKMLHAMRQGETEAAVREMLDSQWHKQVPNRARTLAERYRNG
jgi:lysozyme